MAVSDEIMAGMRETNESFCSSVVKLRDFESLDRIYTADATILPPGCDLIEGISGIKNFWNKTIESLDVSAASLSTVSAEAAGNEVVEIGRAELSLANGQKVHLKYVVHWKLDGSFWKWHTDIWNMNA